MFASALAETMRVPSGLKATHMTGPECPLSVSVSIPAAVCLWFDDFAAFIDLRRDRIPNQDLSSGLGWKDCRVTKMTGADQRTSIPGKVQADDREGMAAEHRSLFTCFDVP